MEYSYAKVSVIFRQVFQNSKSYFLSVAQGEDGVSQSLKPWKIIIHHIQVAESFADFMDRNKFHLFPVLNSFQSPLSFGSR